MNEFKVKLKRGVQMKEIPFSEIEGLQVGHARNLAGPTGVTVIISKAGAAVGVDVRGGAPSTRETDLLKPVNLVQEAHAVFLAGGSAFGLDAGAGIMQYLEEKGIGFDVQVTRVPVVCGAVLFDLALGDHRIRPDKEMGYQACLNAEAEDSAQGNVGAGTGASVGKIHGMDRAMKSGLGTYAMAWKNLKVGALVAVNCLGQVIDPHTGEKLAGPLSEDKKTVLDTEEIMLDAFADKQNLFSGNTTIGVVATNGRFTKTEATKLASMAHNGYARTMRPAHTMYDGDTIFAMSTGDMEADLSVVGFLAANAMEKAVVAAIKNAGTLCGLPSYQERRQW
ncbi:peptidase family T4 [delta proteobacterium NaphS2]|nr:peptidase family T4 [delta proteobacterium NaphS2]